MGSTDVPERHQGHDDQGDPGEDDPHHAFFGDVRLPERPNGLGCHIDGQGDEGRADEAVHLLLGPLDGLAVRAMGFHIEPPKQHRSGGELDDTVEPKADQDDAARGHP